MDSALTPLEEKIQRIGYCLTKLPEALPVANDPKPDFRNFTLDPEWIERIGSRDGAFNREMEVYFGSRANGPITLSERGPGVEALAGVLFAHYKEFPTSFYLEKWTTDIYVAVFNAFTAAKLPMPSIGVGASAAKQTITGICRDNEKTDTGEKNSTHNSSDDPGSSKRTALEIESDEDNTPKPAKKQKGVKGVQLKLTVQGVSGPPAEAKSKQNVTATKVKKADSKIITDFDDPKWVDQPEPTNTRSSGAKTHPLLLDATRLCRRAKRNEDGSAVADPNARRPDEHDDKYYHRCIASKMCEGHWSGAKRNKARMFKHVKDCAYLPREMILRATREVAKGKGDGLALPTFVDEVEKEEEDGSGDEAVMSTPLPPVKEKQVMGGNAASSTTSAEHAKTSSQPSVHAVALATGTKAYTEKVNSALVEVLCDAALPSRLVDNIKFRKFCGELNPRYKLPSSYTVDKNLIPQASALIELTSTKYLASCRDMTISFDGGKIRRPQAIYTFHITNSSRRTFLRSVDDASRLSHTANYIVERLDTITQDIDAHRFSGIVSDNTGNTKKARKLFCEKHPHILNMPDSCHQMDKAVKDIVMLEEFKEVIAVSRQVLAFMSKSHYTVEHFNDARRDLNIGRGLEAVGETRFGTLYWSLQSIQRGFQAFRSIVSKPQLGIDIGGNNRLFEKDNHESLLYELELSKLCKVLSPFAKAIKCLESTHSTAADVYLFWLAVAAQLEDLFTSKNHAGLKNSTIEALRLAFNKRFNQMINLAPTDIYLTAFFLDPRYRNSPVFKNINPLAFRKVRIDVSRPGNPAIAQPNAGEESEVLRRVTLCLLKILKNEYGDLVKRRGPNEEPLKLSYVIEEMRERSPRIPAKDPNQNIADLREQINAYAQGIDPFKRKYNGEISLRNHWKRVRKDNIEETGILSALAIKIFSVVPNSMADERTMSEVSWLNGPKQNRQAVGTVKDRLVIRQWDGPPNSTDHIENSPVVHSPTVKWRDMERILRARSEVAAAKESEKTNPASDEPDADQSKVSSSTGIDVDNRLDPDDDDDAQSEPDSDYEVECDDEAKRADRFAIGLGITIDLKSPELLDILADEGQIQKSVTDKYDSRKPSTSSAGKSGQQVAITPIKDSEWDRWK